MSWIVWMLLVWAVLSVPAFFVLLALLHAAAQRETRQAAVLAEGEPLTAFYPTKHDAAMPVFEPTAAASEATADGQRGDESATDDRPVVEPLAVSNEGVERTGLDA